VSAENQNKTKQASPDKIAPTIATVGPSPPEQKPPDNNAKHTTNKKNKFLERLKKPFHSYKFQQFINDPKVWIEVAALIAVVAYTIYAGKQARLMNETLGEIRKQTPEIAKSAKAATDAATVAQQALTQARYFFSLEQRPYIWLTSDRGGPKFVPVPPGTEGYIFWDWHYTNYGKTPAYGIRANQEMQIGDNATRRKRVFSGASKPGPPLPPTKDDFTTAMSKSKITSQEFQRLMRIEDSIVVFGHFDYRDSGGRKYETGFCFQHLVSGSTAYCPEPEANYIK
jgi:hypothetical protein